MKARKWYLNEELVSVRRLAGVIHDLSAEEIKACLDLEKATQRRQSVLTRLVSRAVRLKETELTTAYLE